MKVHLDLDTDNPADQDYLRRFFPPDVQIIPAAPMPTPPILPKHDGKIRVPLIVATRKARRDDIIAFINEHEMVSMNDFTAEGFKNEAVYACLSTLRKEGVVDSSTDSPKKYFLKRNGNPQLREMLKNSGKTEVMR